MRDIQISRVSGTVMNVNSYLVESAESLVLVDGMLTVSDARAVRARLESSSKPLRGLLVTHAHPDHYAGAAEILAGREQVPIYSTRAVRDMIARDDALKDQIVGPMMGDQWPTRRRFPDAIVDGTLELGDLRFSVKDLGCGESPADSIWSLDERTLFVGDLVYNGMHAYLADGLFSEWIAVLDRLESESDDATRLYVGHGEVAGRNAILRQRKYVSAFVDSVTAHLALPREERRKAVVADMKRVLPSEELQFLMELSIDPVAVKLGAQDDR